VTQGATDLIALLSIGKAKEGGDSKCVSPASPLTLTPTPGLKFTLYANFVGHILTQ